MAPVTTSPRTWANINIFLIKPELNLTSTNTRLDCPFRPKHPEVSFLQIEATFSTANICPKQAPYDNLLASLTNEMALEVCDILASAPPPVPYDTLNATILEEKGSRNVSGCTNFFVWKSSETDDPLSSCGGCKPCLAIVQHLLTPAY